MRYSKMFTTVIGFLVVITITGCQNWPKFHYDPANTGYNTVESSLSTSNVNNLTLLWSNQSGVDPLNFSSPVVSGGVLYVGSGDADKKLSAFNAFTGTPSWSITVGGRVQSTPAVCPTCTADGLVFFGSYDFNIYAVDATTHQIAWQRPTNNIITSSATVANGNVYIGSEDSNLYGFVAATGVPLPGFPVTTGRGVYAVPAVAGNTVYVVSKDTCLYAFNATSGGSPLWTNCGLSTVSSPSVDTENNAVYVTGSSALYAVNATSGTVKWQVPISNGNGTNSPAVANGLVYTTTKDYVYAFPTTYNGGNYVWRKFLGNNFFPSDVSVANGVVYVGMSYVQSNYYLAAEVQALNATTGATLWVSPANIFVGEPALQTTVANGAVYAVGAHYGSTSYVYAFDVP